MSSGGSSQATQSGFKVWMFQGNPENDESASKLEPGRSEDGGTWKVSDYGDELQRGDLVIFWLSGSRAGIYAFGEIDSRPFREEDGDESESGPLDSLSQTWSIECKYSTTMGEPIIRESIIAHPTLSNLAVIRFPDSSNYRVSNDEWFSIREIAGSRSVFAKSIVENLLSFKDERQWCLKIFNSYLMACSVFDVDDWRVSLSPIDVTLYVNGWEAASIRAGGLYATALTSSFTEDFSKATGQYGTAVPNTYRPFVGSKPARVFAKYAYRAVSVITEAALNWVESVARVGKYGPGVDEPHASGAINYLSAALGIEIPERPRLDPESSIGSVDIMSLVQQTLMPLGFSYSTWQLATFYTALQTKGFVILSGISGTGKTKLVQHFAGLLPQPRVARFTAEEHVVVTVYPYMRTYGSVVIPQRLFRQYGIPIPERAIEVDVSIGATRQQCRVTPHLGEQNPARQINLRGALRGIFKDRFQPGDRFVLEPEVDDEQRITGFRFTPEHEWIASGLGNEAVVDATVRNWLFLSARPDWRDSKSLLGYYNPLTGTYEWTEFLRFLERAAKSYRDGDGLAWFVLLDEMNLAHVEYYFADLLSVLESGRDEDGWTREPLRLTFPDDLTVEGELPPRGLRLPPNLYVLGTVNIDETTHAFSPKVLDRAFSIELVDVDFRDYPPMLGDGSAALTDDERRALLAHFTRGDRFARIDKREIAEYVAAHPEIRDALRDLNDRLRPHTLHFGYRVFDEIVSFLAAADENGLFDDIDGVDPAFDAAVLMKVLPKFHGSRGRLETPLTAVRDWCEARGSTRTLERVERMLTELETTGFTAFG